MAHNKALTCIGKKKKKKPKLIIKRKQESEGTDQIWCFVLGQLNNTRAETVAVNAQQTEAKDQRKEQSVSSATI